MTGLELVLPDGEVVTLGGKGLDPPGPDLLGAFIGSEGTLGIVTKVTLRLVRRPEAVRVLLAGFDSTEAAGGAVSEVIAAGILPAAMEIMDSLTLEAVEAAVGAGYPDAGAILIVELDGPAAQADGDLARVEAICRDRGAGEIRIAADEAERALFWKGRKAAFAAMGRVSPSYYVQDGVVPRTRLPDVLRRIAELGSAYGLRVGNVFHAGDGNLHPLVLYDRRDPDETARAQKLSEEILAACIEAGGALTGRARGRAGQARQAAAHVLARRRRGDAAAEGRVRPRGSLQPGQDLPARRPPGRVGRASAGAARPWRLAGSSPEPSPRRPPRSSALGRRDCASRSSARAATSCSRRAGSTGCSSTRPAT